MRYKLTTQEILAIKPTKLSQKDVTKYYKLLYKELDVIKYIIFKKLRNYRGYCITTINPNITYIELDPREILLPTLIHELSHSIFPDMSEVEILTLEASLISRFTMLQYKRLLEKAISKIKLKKI